MAAHHQLAFPVAHTAAAARQARHRVVSAVRSWNIRLGEDELNGVELVVGELITNAVLHAAPGLVTVNLHREGPALVVEVHDTTKALPQAGSVDVDAESGRGLHLVAVLADRHGAEPTATGKRCWAEFDLPAEPKHPRADRDSRGGQYLVSGRAGELARGATGRPRSPATRSTPYIRATEASHAAPARGPRRRNHRLQASASTE
ncbi:ATP-binding protein [Streptomyces sp. NPDC051555]|uniref:ATP-binding protein n=1 Tax=Streptomyces sp. NPDC051555 TaxID=3365657 RepID=UPI0037A80DFB